VSSSPDPTIAEAFDLEPAGKEILRGHYEGWPVEVHRAGQRIASDLDGTPVYRDTRDTQIAATMDPPLRLNLRCWGTFYPHPRWADQPLSKQLQTSATNPIAAQVFLEHAGVRETLGSMSKHAQVLILDGSVQLRDPLWITDLDLVRDRLRAASTVARQLIERRHVRPPPWESALRASWARVAGAWGLTFDDRALVVSGTIRSHGVHVTVDPRGLYTVMRVDLPSPLGCQLELTRQQGMTAAENLSRRLSFDDIRVGDPEFDAAYYVRGRPRGRVLEVLGERARKKLMKLLAASTDADARVKVHDTRVELTSRGLLISPDMLDRTLEATFEAADALSPDTVRAGPFR